MSSSNTFKSSAASIVNIVLKQKNKENILFSFDKIKRKFKYQTKRGILIGLLLAKIYQKFTKIQTQRFFSNLIQNKISTIKQANQRLEKLKNKSKQSSVGLIVAKEKVLTNKIMRQAFHTMRQKSSLNFHIKSVKILSLINVIKGLQKKYLHDSIKLMKVHRFDVFSKYKKLFSFSMIFVKKRKCYLTETLDILKKYNKNDDENAKVKTLAPSHSSSDLNLIKKYQQKKSSIQSELKSNQQSNKKLITKKEKQLQTLQKDLQSFKFSHDLLEQQNQKLRKQIQERQTIKSSQVKNIRKQQKNQEGQQFTLMKEQQIWKSVFCNLMKYLSKAEKEINPESLMQSLSQPLAHKSFYNQLTELQQENNILNQILLAYRQLNNSTTEQINPNEITLPLACLNKQKRYFYLVLECLSRWGASDTQELNRIKSSLSRLKKISQ